MMLLDLSRIGMCIVIAMFVDHCPLGMDFKRFTMLIDLNASDEVALRILD